MLCDLAKRPRQRKLDFDFIQRALLNDDIWALDRKYVEWGLDVPLPPEVENVYDILWMWDMIEESCERLDETEQERVKAEFYMADFPCLPGFFGRLKQARRDPAAWHVNELRIAKVVVEATGPFRAIRRRRQAARRRPPSATSGCSKSGARSATTSCPARMRTAR